MVSLFKGCDGLISGHLPQHLTLSNLKIIMLEHVGGHVELVCVIVGSLELRRSMKENGVEVQALDLSFLGARASFEGKKLKAFPFILIYTQYGPF